MSPKHEAVLIVLAFTAIVVALTCSIPFLVYPGVSDRYKQARRLGYRGSPPERPVKKYYIGLWLVVIAVVSAICFTKYW